MVSWEELNSSIHGCSACPRLRAHATQIAQIKRRSYQGETYWARPISGFGDTQGRLGIVGLAPAAHGANRTGRIFTGDRSGEWLYRALYREGFANQAESTHLGDGLKLNDAYITCSVKCAPPDNRPNPEEFSSCRKYLEVEIQKLHRVKVWIALGQLAFSSLWPFVGGKGKRPPFRHGASLELSDGRFLILSYHPSQQNTFTGRLTEPMFDQIFKKARGLIS